MFPSVLIVGGNSDSRLTQAKEIAPKATAYSPTGVDQVREIRRLVALGQSIIIQDSQNLSEEAQNALLKTLEEPPENTAIILCAPSEDRLLPTVVSRCVISNLRVLSDLEITSQEQKDLEKILGWVGDLPAGRQGDIEKGFVWAAENTDRKNTLETVNKLIVVCRKLLLENKVATDTIERLFEAKKYLLANTNVRLTLENLFIN